MKKTTKSLLLTALILFSAGILLTLGSFIFVKIKGINPYGIEKSEKNPEDKTITLQEILEQSHNSNYVRGTSTVPYSKIDLTSFTGKVRILPAEGKTLLSLEKANLKNLSCEIVGETLTIKDLKAVGFMGFFVDEGGFSFHGLRQIFGPGNSAESDRVITLYLDPSIEVSQISVNSYVGSVLIDGISMWNLNVNSSVGDVTVQNCKITNGKITAEGSFSDLYLNGNNTVSIAASTKIGSINVHLTSPVTQSIIADAWLGNIAIKSDLATKTYKMNLEVYLFGSANQNGQKLGKTVQTDATSAARRVSATTFLGSIHFDYTGGNEDLFVEPVIEKPEEAPSTEPETGEAETAEAANGEAEAAPAA